MNVIKKNKDPYFEIVPRLSYDISEELEITLTSENNGRSQTILATSSELPNENYLIELSSFPEGKTGEKFSYSISVKATHKLLSLGKLIILSENEDVQNFSAKENTKFYR